MGCNENPLPTAERRKAVWEYKRTNPSATAPQIAEALGVKPGLVRCDLHRVRKAAAQSALADAGDDLARVLELVERAADTAQELLDDLKERLAEEPDNGKAAGLANSISGACRVLLDVAKRLESLYGLAAPKRGESTIDVRVVHMIDVAIGLVEAEIIEAIEADPMEPEAETWALNQLSKFRQLIQKHLETAARD